jgi:putative ABC transport system permease protein
MTVVGVVADIRPNDVDGPRVPLVYVPFAQRPAREAALVMKTEGDPLALAAAVRTALWSVDPAEPVSRLRTMDQVIHEDLLGARVPAQMLGFFAGLALAPAAVGIYGVVAYAVVQRTREIGVRVALGARRADVLRLVVVQGLRPVVVGAVAGLAAALALSRSMTALLYGVSPADPATYVGVASLLAAVATVAIWIPARRAAGLDPAAALRIE